MDINVKAPPSDSWGFGLLGGGGGMGGGGGRGGREGAGGGEGVGSNPKPQSLDPD